MSFTTHIAAILLLFATLPVIAQTQSDENAVRQLISRVIDAEEAGDVAKYLGYWGEDSVQIFSGSPDIVGLSQIGAEARDFFTAYQLKVNFSYLDLSVDGSYGFVRANAALTLIPKNGESPAQQQLRVFMVLKKTNQGQWYIWREVTN